MNLAGQAVTDSTLVDNRLVDWAEIWMASGV